MLQCETSRHTNRWCGCIVARMRLLWLVVRWARRVFGRGNMPSIYASNSKCTQYLMPIEMRNTLPPTYYHICMDLSVAAIVCNALTSFCWNKRFTSFPPAIQRFRTLLPVNVRGICSSLSLTSPTQSPKCVVNVWVCAPRSMQHSRYPHKVQQGCSAFFGHALLHSRKVRWAVGKCAV